ncbi:MAG: YkgJ family cysteine cluster protein [Deltaproteobacteria bacterium]|nr:YkgJ family cysteine cluster protein [Deltaproteobacteria bacterium]
MAWQQVIESLRTNHQRFEHQLENILRAEEQRKLQIHCRKGCGNCCRLAVNCSFPEAALIAQQLSTQQQQTLKTRTPVLQNMSKTAENLKQFLRLFRQQRHGCPLLIPENQCCSIYSLRPFSCRSLLSTRPSSWCGVDFADLHPLEKQAFLSSLNREIVAFPTHYLAQPQELGAGLEASTMVEMHDHYDISLGGNLIYLIWLELEYQLVELLEKNREKAKKLLLHEERNHPFLLQLKIS